MGVFVGIVVGILLLLVGLHFRRRLRGRPRTMPGRWAARNGYIYRRDPRVHLFVQGPPFDRGEGVIERVLLVGSCAGRPSLITHFGWHYGHFGDVGGSCVALVLQLPGEVAPLQVERHGGEGDEFDDVYRVDCDNAELYERVVGPRLRRAMMAGAPHERVNLRLDGDALIVWLDEELVRARQLETVHDMATELYRLIPRGVLAEGMVVDPVPVRPRPESLQVIDIHGRRGEAWETPVRDGADEVSVSLLVEAGWPRLSIVAYEWMADHYNATSFDKPDPSAHPLVDIMFAVRSTDDNFRRQVLADLAGWLPLDDRTRRCGLLLEADPPPDDDEETPPVGRITAYTPGQLADDELVSLLADVVHEVGQRLTEQSYRYRRMKLPLVDLPQQV